MAKQINPIPRIPEGTTSCKFIQLYIASNQTPVLAISFCSEDQHGQILKESLESLSITWEVAEPEHLYRKGFPSDSKPDQYELVGAGEFDYLNGEFIARGKSQDYLVSPNIKHFESLKLVDPNFKYKIDKILRR